jgi:hypothetical protein
MEWDFVYTAFSIIIYFLACFNPLFSGELQDINPYLNDRNVVFVIIVWVNLYAAYTREILGVDIKPSWFLVKGNELVFGRCGRGFPQPEEVGKELVHRDTTAVGAIDGLNDVSEFGNQ